MRKLLTLILIITTMGVMGQEAKFRSRNDMNTGIHIYKDSTGQMQRELIVDGYPVISNTKNYNSACKTTPMEDQLLEILTQYQTECYNDSTLFEGYVNKITASGIVWQEWEVFYTHREPTFTGFIEWLKQKKTIL